MGKVRMDGSTLFDSTAKAAAWLHSTGQTKAKDAKSVQGNVARAIRDGGKAYGHSFRRDG